MIHRQLMGLLFLLAATTALRAHPDFNATQNTTVAIVPATEPPPGKSEVSITVQGERRVITANGVPDHPTGRFPNRDNPNGIKAQNYRFTLPLHPAANPRPTPLVRQPFGIALNGVLFDPSTAAYWHQDADSGWHYDAKGNAFSLGLDANTAHVQPNGGYHYHGIPEALLQRLSGGHAQMTLVGWAADGFPVYARWGYRDPANPAGGVEVLHSSYQLKAGARPGGNRQPDGTYDGIFVEDFAYVAGSGDLDECGGRTGVTPEFPEGTYHYVLTDDFPFVPIMFRGTPDGSFASRTGPTGPRRRP